jgi:hypothetical protein
MTGTNASVKNSVLTQSFCFIRNATGYYENQDTDGNGNFLLPGTYTIAGVSCVVEVSGTFYLAGSYNCGWSMPSEAGVVPFINWQYQPESDPDAAPEYLMDYGGSSGGTDDVYCVIAGSGTATGSGGTMFGTLDLSDPTSCTVDLSLGSCGGIASTQPFRSQNTTWSEIEWSGSYYAAPGSAGSPNFSKDSCIIAGYTGNRPTVTANRAGVVHITADSVSQDCIFQIFRNATSVYSYGVADCDNPGDNPPAALSTTFSVAVGDVITLGDPTDYNVCTNIAIWWTAT